MNYIEIDPWFLTRRFLKFSIQIYRKNKPPPHLPIPIPTYTHTHARTHTRTHARTHTHTRRPCFLTNHDGLNNLGGISSKEHYCRVRLKSVQWFLNRRLFKLSRYIGKISPDPPPPPPPSFTHWRQRFFFFFCFFLTNHNGLNNLSRGSPKEHSD